MLHSDSELFDRWQSGDAAAGEELFRRYAETLRRFFYMKVAGNQEDLVQDTFLACLESRHLFQGRSSFRAFLLGVAKFQLYAYYRKSKRDQAHMDLDEVRLADMNPPPGTYFASQSEQRILLEALRCIPLGLQLLLELTYWEEMRAHELAVVFGIPPATVYSRLRRARELLAANFKRLDEADAHVRTTESSFDGWAEAVRARMEALTD